MSEFASYVYHPPVHLKPGETSASFTPGKIPGGTTITRRRLALSPNTQRQLFDVIPAKPIAPTPSDTAQVTFLLDSSVPTEGTVIVNPSAQNPNSTYVVEIDAAFTPGPDLLPQYPSSRYVMDGQKGERVDIVHDNGGRRLVATMVRTS